MESKLSEEIYLYRIWKIINLKLGLFSRLYKLFVSELLKRSDDKDKEFIIPNRSPLSTDLICLNQKLLGNSHD